MSTDYAIYCKKCHKSIGADKYNDYLRTEQKPLILAKFIEVHSLTCAPAEFFIATSNEFFPELSTYDDEQEILKLLN